MPSVDTRNISRDSLFLMADIRPDGAEEFERVKVRNLSAGGMMAEGSLRVVRGARLAIKLRNLPWIEGNVAWVQDNRFGIAFDDEIDPAVVRMQKNEGEELHTPRYVRTAGYASGTPDPARLRKI